MLTRNRTLIALVLVIVVGVVTACALVRQLSGVATAGAPTTLPTPGSTTSAVSTSPASTPSPTSTPTLSPTQADITAAVTNYYKVTDELEQKPPRDPYKKLWTVAKGEAFDMWQDIVLQDRRNGWHGTGSTEVLSVKIGKKVANSKYRVDTCVDVSGADLVDKNGKSVATKNRLDRPPSALVVQRVGKSWYVLQDRDGSAKC